MIIWRTFRDWLNEPKGDIREERGGIWRVRVRWELLLVFWWVPYLLIGLYTFGHNASAHPTYTQRTNYSVKPDSPDRIVYELDTVHTAVKSAIAGAAWPAYWTWDLMDNKD